MPVSTKQLALFLGAVYGGVCGVGVLLSMRPDRRDASDVPVKPVILISAKVLEPPH